MTRNVRFWPDSWTRYVKRLLRTRFALSNPGHPTHFHAGDMKLAIDLLRKAAEDQRGFPAGAMAFPVLAMALDADGQTVDAHQALEDSRRTVDDWLNQFDPITGSQLVVPWFDLLEFSILHREAEQRIDGHRIPADYRLLRLELRAVEMVSQK